MAVYDTNEDDNINLGDNIDSEHLDILIEYCDYNNDGNVNSCEIHDCVIMCENEWRHEYCPESEDLYCEGCPFEVSTCEGAWYCDDIAEITTGIMSEYDTNYNGGIDIGDDIDVEHLDLLMDSCD
jgi:hypothetical protein